MEKKFIFLASCFFFFAVSISAQSSKEIYKDKTQPTEKRVEDLLFRMSVDEKISLLCISGDTNQMKLGSMGMLIFLNRGLEAKDASIQYNKIAKYMKEKTRWGIPGMKNAEAIFAYSGFHSTSFPQPLGQAASWDPSIVSTVADVVGEECKSRGVRLVFAPVVNIARDPRWGRTGETYGEDPYLISRMGVAYVKTMEGKGIVTTLKHFVGNTGHEGKFGAPVFYSERYLREYEFLPYEAAFKEGGAKAVMMAYNTLDGLPCAQSPWLMKKVIKEEWKFDGIIMSDGYALDLIRDNFGIDSSRKMVAAKSINAGCDMALSNPDDFFGKPLKEAMKEGIVSEATVTEAARRILRQIFRTGLYDNPYVDPEYAAKINDSKEHRAKSLEVAKKCLVLLKNEKNTLPFSKDVKKVAIVGPLGNKLLINHYGGWGTKEVTVLEGIKNLLPKAAVVFEKGADLGFVYFPEIESKYFSTKLNGQIVSGLKGEYFYNNKLEGNPKLIRTDATINFDWKEGAPDGFDKDNFSVRWTGKLKVPASRTYTIGVNGDDAMRVFLDEKTLVNMWPGPDNALFVESGQIYLEKDKEYNLRVEYMEKGGAAFAKLGWDADLFARIPKAIETAKDADAIVVVAGMFEDENGDRAILNLDEAQEKLILEMSKLNKPMVVVLQSGNVITMNNWVDQVPAILAAWYPGEEGGNAIAQTLFGDNNPGGKLPITFPKEVGQVPLTYNMLPGRPNDKYLGIGNKPQFPFGHGLSYSNFEYSNFSLLSKNISTIDSITVKVDVKNIGKRAGDEVLQLYIHDEYASVSRPGKELKAFRRVSLNPGESKTVSFMIGPKDLMIWDINMKHVVEPGDFKIMIGSSSEDIRVAEMLSVRP